MFFNSSSRSILFLALLVQILITSCVNSSLSEQELRAYIQNEKHGLVKKEKLDSYEVIAVFRPADLLVAQEVVAYTDSSVLAKVKAKYASHYYFVLSIKGDGKEALTPGAMGNQQFSEVLQTISFRMGDYLNMTTAKDTIPLADYAFSRTFGTAYLFSSIPALV